MEKPEVITFAKRFSCRLEEYKDLLSHLETPCTEINQVWSSIFEDFVLRKVNWSGIWFLSEKSTRMHNLIHPCSALVRVDDCDWQSMTVYVKVNGVQGDVEQLPEYLHVPVIEVHVLKNQTDDDDKINDLKVTADWLDKYRFFFNNLWYPWDKEGTVKEWCSNHLENRLKILYDIKSGSIDKRAAEYYLSVVNEYRNIYDELSEINLFDHVQEDSRRLIKLSMRKTVLQMETDLFENPETRGHLMSIQEERCRDFPVQIKLVTSGAKIDVLTSYLKKLRELHIGDMSTVIYNTLNDALLRGSSIQKIFLCEEKYNFCNICGFESGGYMRGLGSAENTIVGPDFDGERRAVLFNLLGNFNFENVTITAQNGFAVRILDETLKMENCRIVGGSAKGSKGIVVHSGASIILTNCEIRNWETGVWVKDGGRANLKNVSVTDCAIGLKGELSSFDLDEVNISNCKKSYCYSNENDELEWGGDMTEDNKGEVVSSGGESEMEEYDSSVIIILSDESSSSSLP